MIRRALCACCVLLAGVTAWAVQPGTWEHRTEADFAGGEFTKTVVTSLGEIALARATETLVEPSEELGMISAMALDAKGRLYVAAAPGATVYRLEKTKLVRIAELPGVLVRVLRFVDGKLLAGTSGEQAGVYEIGKDDKVTPVWTDEAVTLVWAVLPGPKESLYVATGAEGKVYHLTNLAKGKAKAAVIYDSEDENILSLAQTPDGRLYAGTGENGLIILIDPKDKTGRIIYDAPEAEISRLAVGADGVVYAATSDSSKATGDGEAPSGQETGEPAPGPGPTTRPGGAAEQGDTPSDQENGAPATQPATRPAKADGPDQPQPAEQIVTAKPRPEDARAEIDVPGTMPADMPPEINEVIETIIRKRIEVTSGPASRPAGPKPANGPPPFMMVRGPVRMGPMMPGPSGPPSGEEGEGNAVYRIDQGGFVRSVFRRPVTILDMVLLKGTLILATGHGGQIFSVDLAKDRTSMLVKLDPTDLTVLIGDGHGKCYVGTANKAAVYLLADKLAKKGTFVSSAFDAGQVAGWGTLHVRAQAPSGCKVTVATRSGNVAEPDDKTWSPWSREIRVDKDWNPMTSPTGRFLQYRLTFGGNGKASASVDRVRLVYQVKNLPPVISAVQVAAGPDPESQGNPGGSAARLTHRMVSIEANDPNGDGLEFEVYFRKVGAEKWVQLAEKHRECGYAWNITTVPDGIYEVRVEASDAPANPRGTALTAFPRMFRPVVVDNTRPAVSKLKAKAEKGGKVALSGTVSDEMSRLVSICYAFDSAREWHQVVPKDGICDSHKESFSVVVPDVDPGAHHVAVKAADEYGNTVYASVEVTVEK